MDKAVVLLSGGLDSAVILAQARKDHESVFALTFDYGQTNFIEVAYAHALALRLRVPWYKIRIDTQIFKSTGHPLLDPSATNLGIDWAAKDFVVPERNLLFLAHALSFAISRGAQTIYHGANKNDYKDFPDCRKEFFAAFANMCALAGHTIKINLPLYGFTKTQVVCEAILLGIDPERTWSCYTPLEGKPCGSCPACKQREEAFSNE